MHKKLFFVTIFLFTLMLPANAVLQEDSLRNSLQVLRHELIEQHLEQTKQLNNSRYVTEKVTNQLKEIGEKSAQVSLMLYSQKTDNIFDLTYACQQATELWRDFQTQTRPFHDLITESNEEIARYDSLVNVLSTMYTFGLTPEMKTNSNVCLLLSRVHPVLQIQPAPVAGTRCIRTKTIRRDSVWYLYKRWEQLL